MPAAEREGFWGGFRGCLSFLSLFFGAMILCGGGIDAAVTARFVANAKPAVAEVVSSEEYLTRHRVRRCCRITASFKADDGTVLVGSWVDPIRFAPGSAVPVLYRRAWPIQVRPDDNWALWGGMRIALKMGATLPSVGLALVLAGVWGRRRRLHPG